MIEKRMIVAVKGESTEWTTFILDAAKVAEYTDRPDVQIETARQSATDQQRLTALCELVNGYGQAAGFASAIQAAFALGLKMGREEGKEKTD